MRICWVLEQKAGWTAAAMSLNSESARVLANDNLERDEWFVLKAKRPGVSARELARSYGLEELLDFISHSR